MPSLGAPALAVAFTSGVCRPRRSYDAHSGALVVGDAAAGVRDVTLGAPYRHGAAPPSAVSLSLLTGDGAAGAVPACLVILPLPAFVGAEGGGGGGGGGGAPGVALPDAIAAAVSLELAAAACAPAGSVFIARRERSGGGARIAH